MIETVELRWFTPGPVPPAAAAWFDALVPVACVETRTDRYLAPAHDGCGRKLREGRAEVKQRLGTGARLDYGAAAGTPETWEKEVVEALPDREAVDVAKRRRTRRTELPDGICTLELAAVELRGEAWWTVCLEATSPSGGDPGRALREAARRWLTHPATPDLPAEAARGYPAWLRERCG